MPTKSIIRETCSKRGLILTCYVDGKKRFKSTLLDEQPTNKNTPSPNTENRVTHGARRPS